jgi:hypothetical protein
MTQQYFLLGRLTVTCKNKTWTHQALCDKAVSWLGRPKSQQGHGCHVAVSEVPSGWNGEIPDAIGFRETGEPRFGDSGSVLVEVKVSRADFLADKKKPHRINPETGMGNWRYYLCPEGLIHPSELPDKWGLLYVTPRGGIKPIVGAVMEKRYGESYESSLRSFHQNANTARERFLMVRLFQRIGNIDETNKRIKKMRNQYRALQKEKN